MNSGKGMKRLLICGTLVFVFSAVAWLAADRAMAADETVACTDCHEDKQSAEFLHSPVGEGECRVCHTPEDSHLEEGGPGGMETDRTASACYQCHDNMAGGSTVHPALEMEGECIQCHNPHGSSVPQFLVQPLNGLCMECHDPVPAEAGSGSHHLAVTEGKGCVNCHSPHSSNQASLLVASPKALCLSCHDRQITAQEGEEIDVVQNIKEKLAMPYLHQPATEEDGCTTCHAPHGSQYKKLLTATFPEQNYNRYQAGDDPAANTFALCFGCHEPSMLNEEISDSDTGFRNDTLKNGVVVRENLHWFHVVNAAGTANLDRGRSCNICHDPHGAAQPHNLKSKWTMKSFEPTFLYESRDDGGACLKSCHRLKQYRRLD